jgi:ribosomal protein S27E
MANPIAMAAAFSRLVTITCPWCKHRKLVTRKPVTHRVCPKCGRHFPDPLAAKAHEPTPRR